MASISSRKSTKLDTNFNKKQKRKGNANWRSRTLALEQAYVHDVYSVVAATNPDAISSPVRSYVKNFLFDDFESGSILLDVGCGDGKYLNLNPDVIIIGLEYCTEWFNSDNKQQKNEPRHLVVGDGLHLPFLDDYFDGVICCGVLHHLSTIERRILLLKEITRVLKIGGKLMVTVTSNPPGRKIIESQDVLIKVETIKNRSDYSESDIDTKSYTSSGSETSLGSITNVHMLNNNHMINNNNYSIHFKYDNCYSFVKKALKRLNLTSGITSFRNSFNNGNVTAWGSPVKYRRSNRHNYRYNPNDLYPIELHNLEEYDSGSNFSSKSSSTTGDSALSSFNRSSSLSQTSTNNIFSSSLVSVIKEHFNSWKIQLSNTAVRHSFDTTKPSNNDCDNKHFNLFGFEGTPASHRFSLPITFWKFTKQNESNEPCNKNLLNKNKVYASNEEQHLPKFQNYLEQNDTASIEVDLKTKFRSDEKIMETIQKNTMNNANTNTNTIDNNNDNNNNNNNNESNDSLLKVTLHHDLFFHKSLSLEFFSTQDVLDKSIQFVGYCSSPDISSLPFNSNGYRIDFTNKYNFHRLLENQNAATTSKMNIGFSSNLNDETESNLSTSPLPMNPNSDCSSNDEEMKENPSDLNLSNKKFNKKLLRQRSFSADYQPETAKLQPKLPRRFSASPNIGTHRYNQNDHIPHQQQISIDSEESFVTIIPAHRNSIIENSDLDEEDCDSLNELNDGEPYFESSDEDDDAYCENLSNDEKTSEDNSISSVLEATVRSVIKSDSNETYAELGSPIEDDQHGEEEEVEEEVIEEEENDDDNLVDDGDDNDDGSTPSPPNSLHRYFHLFRSGELEQMIDENIQNLHIIDSYYNDYAMSWCIIAEKIHVWTI